MEPFMLSLSCLRPLLWGAPLCGLALHAMEQQPPEVAVAAASASCSSFSSSPEPSACGVRLTAALLEAFRADLEETIRPPFLGLDEGRILAEHLEVRARVFQELGKSGEIRLMETLHPGGQSRNPEVVLLFKARHYSLLAPLPGPEGARYVLWEGEVQRFYGETGAPRAGQEGLQPVPPDGNCLVHALFFLCHGSYPDLEAVAFLRTLAAQTLGDPETALALEDLVTDLIRQAPDHPWDHDRFAGCGPRVAALLKADPAFQAARAKVLAPSLALQSALDNPFAKGAAWCAPTPGGSAENPFDADASKPVTPEPEDGGVAPFLEAFHDAGDWMGS
jgi:hypothetical protein